MGQALQLAVTLTSIDCGKCGGTYAINEQHRAYCQEKGGGWHCPYCQVGWGWFGNSENDRLKKQLAEEQQRKAAALARANEAETKLLQANRKLQRVTNGTCPCCQRTFKQLAAHMKRKHPDYHPRKP